MGERDPAMAPVDVALAVRRLLQKCHDDDDRREALILAAICPRCGRDHSDFADARRFWSCDCESS